MEVPWGVVINSNNNPPTAPAQVSPIAVADFDFQPGFRAGVAKCLNECTRVSAEYTMWEAGSIFHGANASASRSCTFLSYATRSVRVTSSYIELPS